MLRRLRRLLNPNPVPALSSLEAYALWAAAYPPHAHNALMQTEEAAMRALFPDLHGKFVLDLACGTGRYGALARASGAARVVGVDNSPDMLAANQQSLRALATLEGLPLGCRSVDVVLCGLALGHLPRIDRALSETGRVLKTGGLALISDLHPAVALAGGKRTFTGADGKTYAVEHYVHTSEDYRKAAAQADMAVVGVVERSVAHAPSSSPAVIVYKLEKS